MLPMIEKLKSPPASLYEVLAEVAPDGHLAGETKITRQKETVDGDAEAFAFEELIDHV